MNFYNKNQMETNIVSYPLATALILLVIHFLTGALNWPASGDVDAQRDFNAAIGMSVVTGYLWLTLRILHQNVASSLIFLLVKSDKLAHFTLHRQKLSADFRRHIFNAAIISILLTVIYVVVEGLLSSTQEIHVLFLTAAAVPFWFFIWLFLFQITSNVNYLNKEIVQKSKASDNYLESLVVLIKLGLTNAIFSMGALTFVPIFWFKKDIPSLDVFLLSLFMASIVTYLFFPVLKLNIEIKRERTSLLRQISNEISLKIMSYNSNNSNTNEIEHLENRKERIIELTTGILDSRDRLRIFACTSLLPISWLLIKVVEWLSVSPFIY